MAKEHEVLTTQEVAALLRVGPITVLPLARESSLHREKVERICHFLRIDVFAMVLGNKDTVKNAMA